MLVRELTRNDNIGSKTVFYSTFFSQVQFLQGSIKLPSLKFVRCCFAIKNSKASFATEFDFIKAQFYLKSWCVVKMLTQHLTRCKKFPSKLTGFETIVCQTHSYHFFWFKNCSPFQFFSHVLSVKENTKLPILAFLRCEKLQKIIFRMQSFRQNLVF